MSQYWGEWNECSMTEEGGNEISKLQLVKMSCTLGI